MSSSLYVRCPIAIDWATGTVTVTIHAYVPKTMVKGATGNTHFVIAAGAGTVNFEIEDTKYQRGSNISLHWNNVLTLASTIVLNLPPNSPDTILVAIGIEYDQFMNGENYPLKTVQRNATSIVVVNKP